MGTAFALALTLVLMAFLVPEEVGAWPPDFYKYEPMHAHPGLATSFVARGPQGLGRKRRSPQPGSHQVALPDDRADDRPPQVYYQNDDAVAQDFARAKFPPGGDCKYGHVTPGEYTNKLPGGWIQKLTFTGTGANCGATVTYEHGRKRRALPETGSYPMALPDGRIKKRSPVPTELDPYHHTLIKKSGPGWDMPFFTVGPDGGYVAEVSYEGEATYPTFKPFP